MQTQPSDFLTLVELLHYRAQHQPHQTAYTFLKDGETDAASITYQELDQQSRAIAQVLMEQLADSCNPNAVYGPRALLVYPYDAGLDFIAAFLGCLYAGVVAVPGDPPRNRRAYFDLRDRFMASEATLVLAHTTVLKKLKHQLSAPDFSSTFNSVIWVATDGIASVDASNWVEPKLASNRLAFLQYTSGSTGQPKGVMITHDCLLHNQQVLQMAFGHTEQSIGVGWLPLFHDMGLIGNVLQALYLGSPCILMSPLSFIQKPVRWLQAISRYQATTSGAPNFAYDLLCRHVGAEQLEKLDLSSWDVAFSGAEPIQAATIERFVAKFGACGFWREAFYPCYGMAEATLFIAGGQKADPPVVKHIQEAALEQNQVVLVDREQEGSRSIVGCGQAWLDGKLVIVDPLSLIQCPPNQIGEIWVSSAGIGKGYWSQPDLSDRTFQAYLQDTGAGPFLRTGDLGFLQDGELFITGRLHDVLVFWGLNHYPQHIEQTVEQCHPAFRSNSCAAFSVSAHGEDKLVIVQEVERRYRECLQLDEVIEVIRWEVFEQHFIDVYAIALLQPGSLPKTSSGKVQRHNCKMKFLDGSLEVLSEWRSPQTGQQDVTSLLKRYFNPMIHVKRYSGLVKGRLRRWLYLWLKA
jgi:acyl-CoA synthetase (AMP-forming)/AMP-acid ligase II